MATVARMAPSISIVKIVGSATLAICGPSELDAATSDVRMIGLVDGDVSVRGHLRPGLCFDSSVDAYDAGENERPRPLPGRRQPSFDDQEIEPAAFGH